MSDSDAGVDNDYTGRLAEQMLDAAKPAGRRLLTQLYPALELARYAAGELHRRWGLALAVALLATVGFILQVASSQYLHRLYVGETSSQPLHLPESSPATVWTRWADLYRGDAFGHLLVVPVSGFAAPLYHAEEPAAAPVNLAFASANLATASMFREAYASVLMAVVAVLQSAWLAIALSIILAPLLACVRRQNQRVSLGALWGWVRAYYSRIVIAEFVALALVAATMSVLLPLTNRWPSDAPDLLLSVVAIAVQIALMLAPFAIVGRDLGVLDGIVAGLTAVRRHWVTLLVLFVIYRLAYEVTTVWGTLSPWWHDRLAFLSLAAPGPLLWRWVAEVALALLGLWVAYAFTELVRIPQPPAAPQSEGA